MRQNRSYGEGEIVRRAQSLVLTCATLVIVAGAAEAQDPARGVRAGGGGTVLAAGAGVQAQRTLVPGVWQIVLDDPGTGWQESFLLGIPSQKESLQPPLLVMFHGANVSEWDCYEHTSLFQDALDRGSRP